MVMTKVMIWHAQDGVIEKQRDVDGAYGGIQEGAWKDSASFCWKQHRDGLQEAVIERVLSVVLVIFVTHVRKKTTEAGVALCLV